ncbi:hypothetical protein [Cohnella sp.]|uniref:hypothetical protein n=1 Tax=Cohnella sp. TaxID=1883426 RepID=UPI0035627368
MSNKQVIAKVGEEIIHISNYQKSEHWGKLHCPFCDPPLRVTFNVNGYFKAWPDEGGHNCRKIEAHYFDADWEGKDYVEIIKSEKSSLHVTVDMESLINPFTTVQSGSHRLVKPDDSYSEFPKYELKKKVFRDVIRSIYQMKKLIENNKLASLEKIQFFFKVGNNKRLSIRELVLLGNKIEAAPHYEQRFCIFKVDRIHQKEGAVFYNGFIMNGCQVVATLKYPYPVSKLKKLEKEFVIAYGLIKRAKDNPHKIFLELAHDFQIQSIDDSSVEQLFSNSNIESYFRTTQTKKELTIAINEDEVIKLDSGKIDRMDSPQQNPVSFRNQIGVEYTNPVSPPKEKMIPDIQVRIKPVQSIEVPVTPIKKPEKKKGIIKSFFEKLLGSM